MAVTPENGWHLTPEGLVLCEGQMKKALDLDLKEIGAGFLSDEINKGKLESIESGEVLQVSKIRNTSAPKVNEESGSAPRMLKISLTDGKTTVHGIEMSKLDGISLQTAPGTKVKLLKQIPVSNGFLLFESGSLKVLGGRVEALYDKWEVATKLAQFSRLRGTRPQDGAEGGPPAWIPFGKKIILDSSADKDFKSLGPEQTAGMVGLTPKENAEFESQRKDAILEASKGGAQKVFGAGSKDIKEAENIRRRREPRGGDRQNSEEPSAPVEAVNGGGGGDRYEGGGGRGGRRGDGDEGRRGGRGGRGGGRGGGRNNRDEDSHMPGQAKPSTNVSLFDFLEEKLPGDSETGKSKSGGSKGNASNSHPVQERPLYQAGGRRGDKNFGDKTERYERPDKSERYEKPDRSERYDKSERSERYDKSDRSERYEKSDRSERYERSDRSDRNDRANQPERHQRHQDGRGRGRADHRGGGERHYPENGYSRENGQYDSEAYSRKRGGGPGQGESSRGGKTDSRPSDRGGRGADGEKRGFGDARGERGVARGGRGGESGIARREQREGSAKEKEESKAEAKEGGDKTSGAKSATSKSGRGERGGGQQGQERERGHERQERGSGQDRGGGERGSGRGGRERGGPHDGGRGSNQYSSNNNDRDFGEWSNSTYHNAQRTRGGQQQHHHQQQHHEKNHDKQQLQRETSNLSANMSTMKISEQQLPSQPQQQQQQQSKDFHQSRQGGRGEFQHPGGNRSLAQSESKHPDFTQPPPLSKTEPQQQWSGQYGGRGGSRGGSRQLWNPTQQQQQSNPIKWQVADECLAKYWEDGKFYPVSVTALTETTAVVLFKEYGNHEEVMLKDLVPSPSSGSQRGFAFIPTTPGLPPAFPHT